MSRRQIKALFWPGKSDQALEVRLSKLYHNGYLDWPDEIQRKTRPIPESMVWLGWKGILAVASLAGHPVDPPSRVNENQLRTLQTRLRQVGIRWMREPNWNNPLHDLLIGDLRVAILQSVQEASNLSLETWVPESEFRANPDRIEFKFTANNGKPKLKKKGVCPDGLFFLVNRERQRAGQPHRARFLIELDMATHDNTSFGIEKAAAGAAYIQSQEYKNRFGENAGRWLILTTGETRMKNLMRQTKKRTDAVNLFFFTTFAHTVNHDPLFDPIWRQVGKDSPITLPIA
jgi:hypothetical protein